MRPWKHLQTDSFIKKSFQILKGQFQVHLWFQDKRTCGSERMGWPADKQAERSINFMQYGSEPQTNWKAQEDSTQSSCFSPSPVVTSTICNALTARGVPLHPQSLLPAGFRSGLAAKSGPCFSPGSYCFVNFREPAYNFNHKREHSQAPWLSLVKPFQAST